MYTAAAYSIIIGGDGLDVLRDAICCCCRGCGPSQSQGWWSTSGEHGQLLLGGQQGRAQLSRLCSQCGDAIIRCLGGGIVGHLEALHLVLDAGLD